MAANFWTSSHCKQLLDPEDVDLVPAADRERGITPEEFRLIKIHMSFRPSVCMICGPGGKLAKSTICGPGGKLAKSTADGGNPSV